MKGFMRQFVAWTWFSALFPQYMGELISLMESGEYVLRDGQMIRIQS